MSQAKHTSARSWQSLRHLPRTVSLLLSANAGGTILLAVLSAGMGLFAVADVHVLRRFIETAEQIVEGNAPASAGLLWGLALASLALLQAAVHYGNELFTRHHQEILGAHVEEQCLQQAQAMPLEWYEHDEHYDLLHRVRRRTAGSLRSALQLSMESLTLFVALVSLLVYLWQFNWGLPVLIAIGTTPGVILRTRLLREQYLLEHAQTPRERRFAVYTGLMTGRHAAAEIRLFGLGRWLLAQAGELRRGLLGERLRLAARIARRETVAYGLNGVVHITALGLSIGLLVNGHISIGTAAALFAAIESFQINYADILWEGSLLRNHIRYLQDYFTLMDNPRVDLNAGRRLNAPLTTPIVLENVSFTYPGAAAPALSRISLSIQPDERIALVGENGAGKTTLVKLLMGLYRPTSGRILVDGTDLNEIAPTDWYRKFGTVFQSYLRYQTTVRENITFGWLEGAEDEEYTQGVLARSGADEVAAALAEGLDTPLGKEFHAGTELSVGQWQKLAIARAYFRPAEILILDEPTSALDAKAEAAVYAHFADMAQARTAVLISHRLASCQIADRILVLREGRLVEQGTHAALLSAGGEYAELYRLQAAAYN